MTLNRVSFDIGAVHGCGLLGVVSNANASCKGKTQPQLGQANFIGKREHGWLGARTFVLEKFCVGPSAASLELLERFAALLRDKLPDAAHHAVKARGFAIQAHIVFHGMIQR